VLTRPASYAAWLIAAAGAVTATGHPNVAVRGAAVCVALAAVIAWTYATVAEHFAAVAEENEAWAGTRHVVFGASEEATRAQLAAFRRQVRTTRARIEASRRRRRRPTGPLSIGFDPACDPPMVVGILENGRWWPHGAVQDRR
jgi:hypothetical protein